MQILAAALRVNVGTSVLTSENDSFQDTAQRA